jgi:hypothetical protein
LFTEPIPPPLSERESSGKVRGMPILRARLTWYAFGAFVLTLLSLLSGCAGRKSSASIARYCEAQAMAHVYTHPPQTLRSLALVDSIENDETLVSAVQKTTFDEKAVQDLELDDLSSALDTHDRFRVQRQGLIYEGVKAADRGGYRLEIYELVDGERVRRPDREWEFLKRVDAAAADRIVQDAQSGAL